MNYSSPFDHDSLMYRLMKYLFKIQQQMQRVFYVRILVDIIQFMIIVTSMLGYAIKKHQEVYQEELFDNFLSIFFNYSKIYDWLVMSGAYSAFILLVALSVYLYVSYQKQMREQTKLRILNYCALVGTVVLGLFQTLYQVMANNLTNIVVKIISRQLEMQAFLIGFFLLNTAMIILVSIFNSQRRIFGISLIVVTIALNILPFTLTCIVIILLSFYYQKMEKVTYKKLFYFLIITSCVWSALQINDNYEYLLTPRLIYLGMCSIAFVLYFLYYQRSFIGIKPVQQNQYLVMLYKKIVKKQDKKQDYILADQYFTKYFENERQEQILSKSCINHQFCLTNSTQFWHQVDFKQKLLQKVMSNKSKTLIKSQLEADIMYFQFLLQLKINIVELLRQVFHFMSQNRNQSIYTIYQINKLTNLVDKEFKKDCQKEQDCLKVDQIIYLQEIYKKFYFHYANVVELLAIIFDSLQVKNREINQKAQETVLQFTLEQKNLQNALKQIKSITGNKLQSKIYDILSAVWDKYEKKQQSTLDSCKQNFKQSYGKPKQKFDFSYIVIGNNTIKYASTKFLSCYSYKQSYIVGQNISIIFPNNFNLHILELLKKNVDKKNFNSQILILNQKGMFEVVNATFYLLPQFKGQITYILKINRIHQLQKKNLMVFNSETLCIQCFNKKIVKNFNFSIQKISSILQNGTIQFSDLFLFNNEQKDFLSFTQKNYRIASARNKRMVDNKQHGQKTFKEEKIIQIKAQMKMDYLSDMKKTFAKNVLLQKQISFDFSNITYKIIRVEDLSTKQNLISHNQRTDELGIINGMDNFKKDSALNYTTNDLKRKYQNQQFFCPISNPYRSKILQKINSINSGNRVTHFVLIKILYVLAFILLLAGVLWFNVSSKYVRSQIQEFGRQAYSLNNQYSYFMEGMFNVYQINHMNLYPSGFVKYFQETNKVTFQQAQKIYWEQIDFLKKQKKNIIQKLQSAYFDFPIIEDAEAVEFQIRNQFYILKGSSKTTLLYDILIFLVDTSSSGIKQIIAQNFDIYSKMIKILRPDGRYESKIQSLNYKFIMIVSVTGLVVFSMFLLIYYLLYQLRDAHQDIKLIYTFIQKKQIQKNKKKINQIQQLIEILSSSKRYSTSNLSTSQKQSQQRLQDEFKSQSQLNSQRKLFQSKGQNDSIRQLQTGSIQKFQDGSGNMCQKKSLQSQNLTSGQSQGQFLLGQKGKTDRQKIDNIKQKQLGKDKSFDVFIQMMLNNCVYFFVFLGVITLLGVMLYSNLKYVEHYTQAFRYYEKLRAANFQFRFQFVNAQRYLFYEAAMGKPYLENYTSNEVYKKTHFQYQIPEEFKLQNNHNLCAQQYTQAITHPLTSHFACEQISQGILTHQFSQAYVQYEKSLRLITNSTYQQLITNPKMRETYLNTMYGFYIFKNYFKSLLSANFNENIEMMTSQLERQTDYEFYATVAFAVFSLVFFYVCISVKAQSQLATIVSLIKMIPPQTLFSMNVAALFKKRKILQKLNRI